MLNDVGFKDYGKECCREELHSRVDTRRKEWNCEIENMKKNFIKNSGIDNFRKDSNLIYMGNENSSDLKDAMIGGNNLRIVDLKVTNLNHSATQSDNLNKNSSNEIFSNIPNSNNNCSNEIFSNDPSSKHNCSNNSFLNDTPFNVTCSHSDKIHHNSFPTSSQTIAYSIKADVMNMNTILSDISKLNQNRFYTSTSSYNNYNNNNNSKYYKTGNYNDNIENKEGKNFNNPNRKTSDYKTFNTAYENSNNYFNSDNSSNINTNRLTDENEKKSSGNTTFSINDSVFSDNHDIKNNFDNLFKHGRRMDSDTSNSLNSRDVGNPYFCSPTGSFSCFDSEILRYEFNVSNFLPEEVKVQTQGNHLIVYASHKKSENHKSVSREFMREVVLPIELDMRKLQCSFNKDGILVVQADPSNKPPATNPPNNQNNKEQTIASGSTKAEQNPSKKLKFNNEIRKDDNYRRSDTFTTEKASTDLHCSTFSKTPAALASSDINEIKLNEAKKSNQSNILNSYLNQHSVNFNKESYVSANTIKPTSLNSKDSNFVCNEKELKKSDYILNKKGDNPDYPLLSNTINDLKMPIENNTKDQRQKEIIPSLSTNNNFSKIKSTTDLINDNVLIVNRNIIQTSSPTNINKFKNITNLKRDVLELSKEFDKCQNQITKQVSEINSLNMNKNYNDKKLNDTHYPDTHINHNFSFENPPIDTSTYNSSRSALDSKYSRLCVQIPAKHLDDFGCQNFKLTRNSKWKSMENYKYDNCQFSVFKNNTESEDNCLSIGELCLDQKLNFENILDTELISTGEQYNDPPKYTNNKTITFKSEQNKINEKQNNNCSPEYINNNALNLSHSNASPFKKQNIIPTKCINNATNNFNSEQKFKLAIFKPFKVCINVGLNISPSQLQIDAIDRTLVIRILCPKLENKITEHEISLPSHLQPTEVSANFTNDGILILEEEM